MQIQIIGKKKKIIPPKRKITEKKDVFLHQTKMITIIKTTLS